MRQESAVHSKVVCLGLVLAAAPAFAQTGAAAQPNAPSPVAAPQIELVGPPLPEMAGPPAPEIAGPPAEAAPAPAAVTAKPVAATPPPPIPPSAPLPAGDGTASAKNLDLMIGRDVAIALESGEVFRGRLLGRGGGSVAIRSQFAGEFEVPIEKLTSVRATDLNKGSPAPLTPALAASPVDTMITGVQMPLPGQPQLPGPDTTTATVQPLPTPAPAAAVATATDTKSTPQGFWTKSEYNIEAGLSGSQGNTERSNIRLGFAARWTRPDDTLTLNSRYLYNNSQGTTNQNAFNLNIRNEWTQVASPWSEFVESSVEADEFKPYDALVHVGGGVGYALIKNDKTKLTIRLGAGASKEFDGPDDNVNPEGIIGMEMNQRINATQTLVTNAEVYPSISSSGEFRTNLRAYYEFALTTSGNLNLRFGIEHRYDSLSQGNNKGYDHNDVNYGATLNWRF